VTALLEEAFKIMSSAARRSGGRSTAARRCHLGRRFHRERCLGLVRSPDAPIFRDRRVASKGAQRHVLFKCPSGSRPPGEPRSRRERLRSGDPLPSSQQSALTGQNAFSDRAIGNISRPYFPDGEVGRPSGPLSRPIAEFNPFSTGLQSALVEANIKTHVGFILGAAADVPQSCTNTGRLANGLQIFPGGVPVYRGSQLVGGIGVSGDGIDQDDMISFLGTHNAGLRVGGIGNADPAIRSDRSRCRSGFPSAASLCRLPLRAFLGSTEQNVCQGK
jgi:hypothetical protein